MSSEEIYRDILYIERPVSHHRSMDIGHRAKQFAPFDALKGMNESIKQTEVIHNEALEPVYEMMDII